MTDPSAGELPLPTRPSRRRNAGTPLFRPEHFAPEESTGYLLRLALNSIRAQIERAMVTHDLTAMQWQPLYFIASGNASTAGDLARLMQVDTGAVTRMLDRLECKGLLVRERSTADRRVIRLALTQVGQSTARFIPEAICTALNTHLSDFDSNEAAQLDALLRRIIANGANCASPVQPR